MSRWRSPARRSSEARQALDSHGQALKARVERLVGEDTAWEEWMRKHPGWDSGAWDALSGEDKRAAVKAGRARPASLSTWRDERAGDGSRQRLFKRRKTSALCAVSFHAPPTRVNATRLRGPMVGDVEVLANNGFPEASRILSWRLCTRTGRAGRTRVEVHLSVRIDVEKKKPRKSRRQVRISAADAGCADTLTWHDGKRLRLATHTAEINRALGAQTRMNRYTLGSRAWTESRERYRRCRRRMTGRDRDSVRKAAATSPPSKTCAHAQ